MGRDALADTVRARGYYLGDLPPAIWSILQTAHEDKLYIKGDVARAWAEEVALAASLGWISNVSISRTSYTKTWRITSGGLVALEQICGKQPSGPI